MKTLVLRSVLRNRQRCKVAVSNGAPISNGLCRASWLGGRVLASRFLPKFLSAFPLFTLTLTCFAQSWVVLFQSDGSSLSPFTCQFGGGSPAIATVSPSDGNPAPSFNFESVTNPYPTHVLAAIYTLPELVVGQNLHGSLDFKFDTTHRYEMVIAGFGVNTDSSCANGTPLSGNWPIPSFGYTGTAQRVGYWVEGPSGVEPVLQPDNSTVLSPDAWHHVDFSFGPVGDGTYAWELKINGNTTASGLSYGEITGSREFGVWMGIGGSGLATHVQYDNILVELIDNRGCPDPTSIDYQGFTAASCAVPQNAISVFDQTELDAYMANFGFDGTTVKNVKVNFNPTGQAIIISPCEVHLNGMNNYLDINADKLCVYGRKGITVAIDAGNPDRGITGRRIALVSEEGDAGFSKGLELIADEILVQAAGQAQIGLDNIVNVEGVLALISDGDMLGSNAIIRQNSEVTVQDLLLMATRGAVVGDSAVVNASGDVVLESTGSAVKSVAEISQGVHVTAKSLNLTSGNKSKVGQSTSINVTGEYGMNADGTCSIASSASISAGSISGNCFP